MKKSRSTQVVIADDHSIIRIGVAAVLNREPDLEVVAQARNWPEAVELVLQHRPGIAVLDLHMCGMQPADGITAIHEKSPATPIIIFSAFTTDEEVYEVLRAGARGYVLKGESGREDLLTCIRAVLAGETWIHPIAATRLADRITLPSLTARELEVLHLLAMGKSNKEIGSALDVTEGTIKVHVNHIFAKLGVTGRVEAIMLAVQRGMVPLLERLQDPARAFIAQENRPTISPLSRADMSKAIESRKPTSQLPTKR